MVVHQSKAQSCSLANHSDYFDVDVLLPKPMGLMFTVKCHCGTSFSEIKSKVWQKISNMIDFGQKDKYSFEGINEMAVLERYDDDRITLQESKLSYPVLKLVEKPHVEGKKEKLHLADLLMLVGRNVTVDIEKLQSIEEVKYFRDLMENTSLNYKNLRDTYDYKSLLNTKYPVNEHELDPGILDFEETYNVLQYTIYVETRHKSSPNSALGTWQICQNFLVPFRTTVKVMLQALAEIEKLVTSNTYVLKVSGQEDFFFDDTLIVPRYKYIQSCIRNNTIPVLVLTTYEELCKLNELHDQPETTSPITEDDVFPGSPLHYEPVGYRCVSQIKERFTIRVKSLSDLDLDRNNTICVYVALYSGHNRLEQLKTSERAITSVIDWNETFNFSIDVADLPRDAKLCFSIKRRLKKSKKDESGHPSRAKALVSLYWLNMTVFDFQGTIRYGTQEHHVWKDSRSDAGFRETGTCFPYILADTPVLTVCFLSPIASYYTQGAARQIVLNEVGPESLDAAEELVLTDSDRTKLEKLLGHPYGSYQLTEDDSTFLWIHRVHCLQYPHSIPRLIASQRFDSLHKTTQLYTLLLNWPAISVATALQLLHLHISDPHIREFAVYSLDDLLSDDMVSIFCLQLVECLKYELYVDSALLRFLLKRALGNNILGHELFWHLKTEVESPEFGVQFSMFIEFYLRCCGDHMKELNKISESISKIRNQYEKIKKMSKDELKVAFNPTTTSFNGVICMTKPRCRSEEMIHEKTKVFDSAMRPMLLSFSNQDPTDKESFGMIYKEGDDLRQDQLVLQIINLVNRMWLSEHLDMRLIVYTARCIRRKAGVIEQIKNSETLFGLIKNFRTLSAIELWLHEKNPSTVDFEDCRQNFIKSCCGYTLIQYVLGISDRHPSNIMLTEDGKLVHIDFGHILGNTKSKYGVSREPSPFIFMKEFADLISLNGADEFKKFEQLFVKAYLILRKHSEEFLTILHLMLSAGLPELNHPDHIQYFSEALCLGLSDDEAERRILSLLHDSINMTTKQQMHWLAHVLKHA